jgi:hypothetical protein
LSKGRRSIEDKAHRRPVKPGRSDVLWLTLTAAGALFLAVVALGFMFVSNVRSDRTNPLSDLPATAQGR